MAYSTTENQATPQRSKWPRYFLLLIITIAFFFLNQPLNLASIFVFVMLVLGTPVFEFLYIYIDNLEPLLLKLSSLVNLSNRAEKYLGSLKDALNQKAQFIYFAGYAYDLDALEGKLQAYEGSGKSIPILGGDGLYDLSRYIDSTYSLVYSTVYASPIETADQFASEYDQLFGPTLQQTVAQTQYSLLPPHSILAYDATRIYLEALDKVLSQGEDLTQTNMDASLATVSFTGESGSIAFNGPGNSNPLAKPIYVLCADQNHLLHEAAQFLPGLSSQFLLKDVAACM